MKTKILSLFCLMALGASAANYELFSPNGKLKVTMNTVPQLTWSVSYNGQAVLQPSTIDIQRRQGKKMLTLGMVDKVSLKQVKSSFKTPFYKKATVKDEYGQLLMYTDKKMTIEVRAYDDGAAYRLISTSGKAQEVVDETVEYCFADDYLAFVPYVNDNRGGERYCYSFESYYDEQRLSQMYDDSLAITPLAVCLPGGIKAIPMDAGVENYPGMFLKKGRRTLWCRNSPAIHWNSRSAALAV